MLLGLISKLIENTDIETVGICICCLSKGETLINMKTCEHTGFLLNYVEYKLDPAPPLSICCRCHHMLRKIKLFKQQVEDSIALLTNQGNILTVAKFVNLKRTEPQIESTDTIEFEVEVKSEPLETEVATPEAKVENDFSDYETDIPLADLKKQKCRKRKVEDKRYEGRITMITLSEKELEGEREEMRKKEGYLKLPYKCESCIVGFDHEGTLTRHKEGRHKKTKSNFRCHICQSVLGSKLSFNEHMRRHYRRYECVSCGRRFNHMLSAVQHHDERHAPGGSSIQPGYTCQECGFITASNRVYRYHMDKHKKKPKCDMCGHTFVNANGLRVHMYTVHQQSPRLYQCHLCDKTYRAKSGLFTHTRSVHAKVACGAYCADCKTYYKTEAVLAHHLRTHSNHVTENDKKYICGECGERFVLKESLRNHINWSHLKTMEHRCLQCSKIFKSAGQLRKHISFVHDKKRPPLNKICDYCGRAFTTQSILQCHIRTHTGERPLQCKSCPATFAHSAALYTHNKLLHNK